MITLSREQLLDGFVLVWLEINFVISSFFIKYLQLLPQMVKSLHMLAITIAKEELT